MGEMTKKPTVPVIRFKGFTDTWEQRKLVECFSERVENMPDGELISVTINDGIKKFSELGRHDNSNDDKSKYKKVCVGDIAYNSMRMWQGASGYSPYEGIVSPAYTVLSPNARVFSRCIAYQFKLPQMVHTFQINSQGITSDNWNLKYPTLSEIEIYISKSVMEQKQIAEFFTSLDNLITLHQRKLDKLHKVKRSLLERMFPRNGANVPEIRFSGFTDAWEQCELGAIIQAVQELTSDFENYPLYSLTIENGVTPKTERYERSFLITKETDLFKIVPEQCFVSNPMNLRFGAIGFNDSGKKVSVSGYYDVFSIDRGECSNFWCVYLKTANSLKRFDDVAIGSLIEKRRVHFSQLTEMSFPAPNMNEKRKLGEFFERLERLITLHQRKLDKLRQIKRSMLEKMFV